ncbi:hypothetical protein ACSXC4_13775 [Clostridium perfringens]|uniref:hypothetical protein n=1 Tax=Clostridium TaxID=1485 RepID=UPI000A5793AA|nr:MULTISPECIES: hypothetical protein [Clostridium]EIF2087509.1 hypothetical protein [Clostridium perfringens]EIF2808095.1 hypothetical protein [Clostridium perfringens]EIF6155160.1 hypothetical protein [Clostridium perfringens]EJT6159970.1 hypothetical protein [Clostridium perfringens]ELC8310928.1 hypothetical protein [Clostridium perfringens]
MNNTCKKKGCNNEALNGSKYCNYHQSKREDTKKMIINGASALATFVIAIALKKPGKK